MNPEKLIAALDGLITDIDNALDELVELDTPETEKASEILVIATMRLNALIDDLTDDREEPPPASGAM